MKRIKFKITVMILLTTLLLPLTSYGMSVNSNSAILMETGTGKILYEKNSTESRAIASTSKIMTYILAMEAIEEGRVNLEDQVYISKRAGDTKGSSFDLKEGEMVGLRELIDSMLIISANDSAVAIAEHIDGSVERFTERMNAKGYELNLHTAYFYNPNGLPLEDQSQNTMSAEELLKLSDYAVEKYGYNLLGITNQEIFYGEYKSFNKKNTNNLLGKSIYADGLKTGYTNRAKFCMVGMSKFENGDTNRLIAVVLGGKTSKSRDADVENLLKYGLNNFDEQVLYKAGDTVRTEAIYLDKYTPIEIVSKETHSTLYAKDGGQREEKELILDSEKLKESYLEGAELKGTLSLSGGTQKEINLFLRKGVTIYIDNEPVIFEDAYPYIEESATMLPLRILVENLGFSVEWIQDSGEVRVTKGNDIFKFKTGESTIYINNKKIESENEIVLKDNRTYVPLRLILENIGYDVDWIQEEKQVDIATN